MLCVISDAEKSVFSDTPQIVVVPPTPVATRATQGAADRGEADRGLDSPCVEARSQRKPVSKTPDKTRYVFNQRFEPILIIIII